MNASFKICKVIALNKCTLSSGVNQRLVLQNAFHHNLLTYSLSNSDLLVNFNGKSMPSGAYILIRRLGCPVKPRKKLEFQEGCY